MPESVLDANRGLQIRFGPGGMEVAMYKDTPGIYLSVTGAIVSEQVAAAAGFPVKALGQKREIQLRKETAFAAIEEEFSVVSKSEVIAEAGGFQVVSLGIGRHEIRDPTGAVLTEKPMSKKAAKLLLQKLAPTEVVPDDRAATVTETAKE